MLGNYNCHPTFGCWVIVAFAFVLDLAAINARIFVKYNKENYSYSWRDFLRTLTTSLAILYIKNMVKSALKLVTLSLSHNVLQSCSQRVTPDVGDHELFEDIPDGKRHICFKYLHGLEDKERCQRKASLKKEDRRKLPL